MPAPDPRRYRLFVYGTLLPEEADHELLARAEALGPAQTKPIYKLVELGASAGLIEGGDTTVVGELYEVDVTTLAACDVKREHPVLYLRMAVELSDGSVAQSYFLRAEQTRGRRRIRGGDWRQRFAPQRPAGAEAGPFVRWSKSRYSRR